MADAHGAERFALFGISSGAAAAVAYAARHPERVSHLVLLAGYTHSLLHRNPSAQTLAFYEAQLKLIELGWGRNNPGVKAMFTSIPGARFELLRSRNQIPLAPEPALERMCQVITEYVAHKPPLPQLTPRERELAGLVGQGLDNLQIAARLGLAEKAVRNMLSALYTKLGREGRAMAVVKAREMSSQTRD